MMPTINGAHYWLGYYRSASVRLYRRGNFPATLEALMWSRCAATCLRAAGLRRRSASGRVFMTTMIWQEEAPPVRTGGASRRLSLD